MESESTEAAKKRMKTSMEVKEGDAAVLEMGEEEESDVNIAGSEEMESEINHILEKIERFTQLISELLESGKAMFVELSKEFEERMIVMHKEQMEKWQEEIRELRLLDASNEEVNAVLHNARYLLHNVQLES